MKIRDVLCVAGRSGYMLKDLQAIRAGKARPNGFHFDGDPVTPGFRRITQPGEMLSVILLLEDNQVAFGDCMDVIFSGAAGRDPVFHIDDHLPIVEGVIRPRLVGRELTAFRPLAEEIDRLEYKGTLLHTALRYGVTQAVLHAVSLARHETMAETVAREYGCEVATSEIPILGMCPTDQRLQVDKMIMKGIAALPHANFVTAADLGSDGRTILEYTAWLARRIRELGAPGYCPKIHLDVYGGIGELCAMDAAHMAAFMMTLAEHAAPYELLIETPVVTETQQGQIEVFCALKQRLTEAGSGVKLIADEWCNTLEDVKCFADARAVDYIQVKTPDLGGITNTIEALRYCRQAGVGAYSGGSANETDQSARVCAHIALACQADIMMCKPGQGVDEGLVILTNEMRRTLALIAARTGDACKQ
jgi:methylaspartate ammonia-lyase